VANWALNHGLLLIEPTNPNSSELADWFASLKPDLVVVAAFGSFLGSKLLSLGRTTPINLHPSLLPRHRGPAPINWALIQGDKRIGVSTMQLVKEMDAGPILQQFSLVPTPADISAGKMEEILAERGAELLLSTIMGIKKGSLSPKPQDQSEVTINPLLKKQDGFLNFSLPAKKLANLINGVDPWPGATCEFNNKRIKFFNASFRPGQGDPGKVLGLSEAGKLEIGTGEGILLVSSLHPEGKNRQNATDFYNGYRPSFFSTLV
jgi:methionyl-tRNA formyltransferase